MRHMHFSQNSNYYNRTVYYHDHPGDVILVNEGDGIQHDHDIETPTYLVAPRFLPPVDEGGAD